MKINRKIMETPKKTKTDIIHPLIKGALGIIPYAGGGLSEIYNALVIQSFDKRVNDWREVVSQQLEVLLKNDENKLSEILSNEEFHSMIIQTSIAAYKTHQEEKRKMLLNALFNSTNHIGRYDVNEMYVKLIDELSLSHLIILKLLYINYNEIKMIDNFEFLYKELLEFDDMLFLKNNGIDLLIANKIIKELESKGLLLSSEGVFDVNNLVQDVGIISSGSDGKLPKIIITNFGVEFIRFIDEF